MNKNIKKEFQVNMTIYTSPAI